MMKRSFMLWWIIVFGGLACNKTTSTACPDGLEEGRIIGYDFRKCACCSGYWIEVGGDTLRSFTLPRNVAIPDTTSLVEFDIPVCLSYEAAVECNLFGELIEVGEMVLR